MHRFSKFAGQATITTHIALVAASAIVASLGAYYGGQISQNEKIAEVRQTAAVLDARVVASDARITANETAVQQINSKLDALLIANGISPKSLSVSSSHLITPAN